MQILPFSPGVEGVESYRFATAIDDETYIFEASWNHRDECWYLDLYEADGDTAIFHGVKIVLGAHLGRMHRHALLDRGALIAHDTSGQLLDAGFSDLGARVLVFFVPADELLAARIAAARRT